MSGKLPVTGAVPDGPAPGGAAPGEALSFFATCPKGMETLLAAELSEAGAVEARPSVAGVLFRGPLTAAYRACLWSRTASRVLLTLSTFRAASPEDIYEGVAAIAWEDHLSPTGTLAVDFSSPGQAVSNTLFGAMKVKDAVVDRLRRLRGVRPSVSLKSPDLRVNVHLSGDEAVVSLDLSGESLHRRGYRMAAAAAPLKENLAAAVLLRAGWPEAARAGFPFLDPMCGSGTLPIEAAMMAADIAPGLRRRDFGFLHWPGHDAAAWNGLLEEARVRREEGLRRPLSIHGSDADPAAAAAARANAARAGLARLVVIATSPLRDCRPPAGQPGLMAVNPPYGERLSNETALRPLYEELGLVLRERFQGWRVAMLTGNPDLALRLGIRARRRHILYNGPIRCVLFHLQIEPSRFMHRGPEGPPAALPAAPPPVAAPPEAAMLADRLRKNLRTIGHWAEREGITCWRLYDADLPEYNVAVDVYRERGGGPSWALVQEYEAPPSVAPEKAAARLALAVDTVQAVLALPRQRVVLKIRRRQKDLAQYQKLGEAGETRPVEEGGHVFLVNFTDYLDTGLFLDHRPTRRMLGAMAAGKRFLNLFCYTGSATVYAAAGGAASTVSVDLSPVYLDWARRNLELNGLHGAAHRLFREDCRRWLRRCRERFDLIFLDPPTFSRSKRMSADFNLQRDHPDLIRRAADLLEPGGTLVFSNNFRKFKMDTAALTGLVPEDITPRTIPRDFARHPRVHSCWLIRRPAPARVRPTAPRGGGGRPAASRRPHGGRGRRP